MMNDPTLANPVLYMVKLNASTTVMTNKLILTTNVYPSLNIGVAVLIIAKQVNNVPSIHYSSTAQVGTYVGTPWTSNNFGVPINQFYYPQLSTHCFLGIFYLHYRFDMAGTVNVKFGWTEYYPDIVGLTYNSRVYWIAQ
jgi:hypothetical protein